MYTYAVVYTLQAIYMYMYICIIIPVHVYIMYVIVQCTQLAHPCITHWKWRRMSSLWTMSGIHWIITVCLDWGGGEDRTHTDIHVHHNMYMIRTTTPSAANSHISHKL